VPHFTYHGDFLKADRHGIRGSFFDSDRLDLTVSAALSPPANSDDIAARSGMPDLKATSKSARKSTSPCGAPPTGRASSSCCCRCAPPSPSKARPGHRLGLHPKLNMDITDIPGMAGWNLGLLAGPLFGDKRQHAYYYAVAPQYATAARPAYEAASGYAGMQYLAALSKRFPKYWVGAFVRYDNLSGAAFENSPLVRQKDYVAGGIAISWILGESSTRVKVDD
jgi:outer membrane scaffolding protein for murein synthesis (MipA/OmpV family)